ncbi:MAG: lipid-A-disaccharide synthase [Rhabdochlamydiaceae bacterium]|nr:lipid-A-disaccharide synthase [Candidatus Amphrikana amoebophyrae]
MNKCDLFISAAEPSGDLHGAELLKCLYPYALNIHGIAGPRMRKLGIQTHYKAEDFNVMGFFDVIKSLPKLIPLFNKVKKTILKLNPKVVLLIDYPGFHLRMAKALKKAGYKGQIIQYVCPTVWAWKKNRIQTMKQNLDLLLTLFPFEPQYFDSTPLRAHFVGHPLSKTISKKELFRNKDPHLLAIFPGSRKHEILRNLPKQLKASAALKKLHPQLKIQISVADTQLIPLINKLNIHQYETVNPDMSSTLMQNATYGIATSGTVTLELALHGVQAVVTYGLSRVDQFIATKLFNINLPFYCIVNIILGKCVYTELIGTDFTSLSLLKNLENLMHIENSNEIFLEFKNALTDKDNSIESSQEIMKLM